MLQIIKLTAYDSAMLHAPGGSNLGLAMGLIEAFGHLWHAVAPSIFVGSLLWGCLWLRRDQDGRRVPGWAWTLMVVGGTLALVTVWALEGHEGRMLAYVAMVAIQGGLAAWLRLR